MYLCTMVQNYNKILFAIVTMLVAVVAIAQPRAKYDTIKHDFGTINAANGKVSCTFEVENVGDKPLVILGVYVTCGCTTYEHTEEPIAPGEKGSVKVTLDPKGREGSYIKSIHVYTNTHPRKKTVRIHSFIVP